MILYYPPTRKALYIPPWIGTVKSDELIELPPDESPRKNYLLLRHPRLWVLRCHLDTGQGVPLKVWMNYAAPKPQSIMLPFPDWVIRAESFEADMSKHFGVAATIDLLPIKDRQKLCTRTSIAIRRMYAKEFAIGDYDP